MDRRTRSVVLVIPGGPCRRYDPFRCSKDDEGSNLGRNKTGGFFVFADGKISRNELIRRSFQEISSPAFTRDRGKRTIGPGNRAAAGLKTPLHRKNLFSNELRKDEGLCSISIDGPVGCKRTGGKYFFCPELQKEAVKQ